MPETPGLNKLLEQSMQDSIVLTILDQNTLRLTVEDQVDQDGDLRSKRMTFLPENNPEHQVYHRVTSN